MTNGAGIFEGALNIVQVWYVNGRVHLYFEEFSDQYGVQRLSTKLFVGADFIQVQELDVLVVEMHFYVTGDVFVNVYAPVSSGLVFGFEEYIFRKGGRYGIYFMH